MSKPGYIYLIKAEGMYRFKIGCASNVKNRFSAIQSSSPIKLILLGYKKSIDMFTEEKKYHNLFRESYVFGEWFDLNFEQFKQIYKIFNISRKNFEQANLTIPFFKRTIVNLIIGNKYYISFGCGKVHEVILEEINDRGVVVRNANPKKNSICTIHHLFKDEVRESPIDAILNEVTF